MKVCFIHIRISVASGHHLPNLRFKAAFLSLLNVSKDNCMPGNGDRILEESKSKSPYPKLYKWNLQEIDNTKQIGYAENEQREALLKLKGLRYERDLIIETFENIRKMETFTETSAKLCASSSLKTGYQTELGISPAIGKLSETSISNSPTTSEVLNNSLPISTLRELNKTTISCTIGAPSYVDVTPACHRPNMQPENVLQHTNEHEISELLSSSSTLQKSRLSPVLEYSMSSAMLDCKSNVKTITAKPQLTNISFFSGNPTVDITNGIIHLYKTNYKVPVGDGNPPPETNVLCMLSVPASIDAHGLMEFIAPYNNVIHRMRIIRDRTPNQYMVLLTFITHHDASEFFINMNNQHFSFLFPEEICHLAFVASVEALPSYEKDAKSGGGFLPLPQSTELPDCMVCLERMDESVQGLLTILCNHSFHAACLQQWEDLCCPVCRYVQTPEAQSDNKCMICGATEDLWICLICGNVGCGRYTSEHAQRHYQETHHNYAMALSDNRVWDYAGDYFVHRLFQNKEDGKLVEKKSDGTLGEEHEAKLQAIQLECIHLLTSQLESQRKYWEEQVAISTKKAIGNREEADTLLKNTLQNCEEMEKKMKSLENEKQSLSQRSQNLSTKLGETLRDLSNERELNHSLTQNQDIWKNKVLALEGRCTKQQEELCELKDQLRDVMFYIEAGQKVKSETKEIQGELRDGQVIVGASKNADSSKKGRGKRGR